MSWTEQGAENIPLLLTRSRLTSTTPHVHAGGSSPPCLYLYNVCQTYISQAGKQPFTGLHNSRGCQKVSVPPLADCYRRNVDMLMILKSGAWSAATREIVTPGAITPASKLVDKLGSYYKSLDIALQAPIGPGMKQKSGRRHSHARGKDSKPRDDNHPSCFAGRFHARDGEEVLAVKASVLGGLSLAASRTVV